MTTSDEVSGEDVLQTLVGGRAGLFSVLCLMVPARLWAGAVPGNTASELLCQWQGRGNVSKHF